MHVGAAAHMRKEAKQAERNYALTTFRAKVNAKADSSLIFSLREEIGILRAILEGKLNLIKDETDLWMHSQQISDLVLKLEKLVTSCVKTEVSMGQMLDRNVLSQIATEWVAVLSEELKDNPEMLDRISTKFQESLDKHNIKE